MWPLKVLKSLEFSRITKSRFVRSHMTVDHEPLKTSTLRKVEASMVRYGAEYVQDILELFKKSHPDLVVHGTCDSIRLHYCHEQDGSCYSNWIRSKWTAKDSSVETMKKLHFVSLKNNTAADSSPNIYRLSMFIVSETHEGQQVYLVGEQAAVIIECDPVLRCPKIEINSGDAPHFIDVRKIQKRVQVIEDFDLRY